MRRGLLATAVLIALSSVQLSVPMQAQDVQVQTGRPGGGSTPPQTGPAAFEVASVKPNRTGSNGVQIGIQPGGRLNATNVTVRELVRLAYQVQPFQIVGGPAWITSDRFDIQAKAESDFQPGPPPQPGGPPGPLQLMMQGLLAERFNLKVHTETRDMPIYELVTAQRSGSLGPKLKASTLDCAAQFAGRGRAGAAPPPPGAGARGGGQLGCGVRIGPGALNGNGVGMTLLANSLSQMVQRVVADKTGLAGNFEFEVTFAPEQGPVGTAAPGSPVPPPIDANAPSIYTAIQEQLGLKLESARGPVSVVVIDAVAPPTPD